MLVSHFNGVSLHNRQGGWEDIGAISHLEARGKACGIDFYVADVAFQRVNHQHSSSIGHIKVYVKGLIDTVLDIHIVTGSEQTRGLRGNGVAIYLRQMCPMAKLCIEGIHALFLLYISCRQMLVVTTGNVQSVRLLLTVHVVLVVFQTDGVTRHVVEREVYIVGIVTEDGTQVCLQRRCQLEVGQKFQVGRQLCLQLRLNVCHKIQLVVYLEAAVRQVIVNCRAGC